MSEPETQILSRRARKRWRAFAVFGGVAAAEVGLFLLLGQTRGASPSASPEPPPFEVILYDPPPPPELRETPAPEVGGGAPAAPSRLNAPPPPPKETPRELSSPLRPAPAPDPVVVGAAPAPSAQPGFGQGGQGDGSGEGVGAGAGPGSGSTGPRLVTGPTLGQIRSNHPQNARSRYGRVELSCVIRIDQRLEGCRVLDESPPGLGFGAAGIRVADYFRFQPPTENGRPLEGQQVTVGVDFGQPR